MPDQVDHRCRARDNCAGNTLDGPAVTANPNTICNSCIRNLQEQLEQLPHLQDALESFKRPSLVGEQGSKVSASATPPAPVNLTVVDLVTEIWRVVNRAGGPEIRIQSLVTEPGEYFPVWRSGRPCQRVLDGVDRALDIGAVWRKADRIVGLSRQWVHRHAPCLRCNQKSLGMFAGEDTVHCTNGACGKTYGLTEYERLCIAKAEVEKITKKKSKRGAKTK